MPELEALPVLEEIVAWLGPLEAAALQRTCRSAREAWWQHLAQWLPEQVALPWVSQGNLAYLRRNVIGPLAAARRASGEWVRPVLPRAAVQWAGLLLLWLPDAWQRLSVPAGIFELGGLSAPLLEPVNERFPDPRISDIWYRLSGVQYDLDDFYRWRRQLRQAALPLQRWAPTLASAPVLRLAEKAIRASNSIRTPLPADTEVCRWTDMMTQVRLRQGHRLAGVIVRRQDPMVYRLFPALQPEQLVALCRLRILRMESLMRGEE